MLEILWLGIESKIVKTVNEGVMVKEENLIKWGKNVFSEKEIELALKEFNEIVYDFVEYEYVYEELIEVIYNYWCVDFHWEDFKDKYINNK